MILINKFKKKLSKRIVLRTYADSLCHASLNASIPICMSPTTSAINDGYHLLKIKKLQFLEQKKGKAQKKTIRIREFI